MSTLETAEGISGTLIPVSKLLQRKQHIPVARRPWPASESAFRSSPTVLKHRSPFLHARPSFFPFRFTRVPLTILILGRIMNTTDHGIWAVSCLRVRWRPVRSCVGYGILKEV